MIEDLRAFIEKASKDLDAGCLTNEQIHSMVLELCEMSRSDERALESHLVRLYQHMLKYAYQKDHQSGSWICTIREQSDQISRFVKDKTLVQRVFSDLSSIYNRAKRYASVETNLPLQTFPTALPDFWSSFEKVSDIDFIEDFLRSNAYSQEAKKYLYM